MAIAKRPSKQTADTEKAAEAFISKAGKAPPANGKTPVLFRFKNDFLERIDPPGAKRKLTEIRLPGLLEHRGASQQISDGKSQQKKKLFIDGILDIHSNGCISKDIICMFLSGAIVLPFDCLQP